MFFGNARVPRKRGAPGPQRGSDLRYDLEITLEEAFAGTTKEIVFDRHAAHATRAKAAAPSPER